MSEKRPLSEDALRKIRDAISVVHAATPHRLPKADLIEAVREAKIDGQVVIDFSAEEHLGHPLIVVENTPQESPLKSLLSPRELEVASLVAQGLANKEIAIKLGISLATTKDHIHRILEKTGFPNRAAIAAAIPR